ncbi:MAG TPA: carboxylesterase family protein [Candidatus Acidoferrales bacterium]|jgi:para-nitrobenzyl esterase|nr:carboxylesterase family protein [Candidatus Acidoferrales bacterium]
MIHKYSVCLVALAACAQSAAGQQIRYEELRTANGVLEGVISADGKVRTFKGIPYAAPPVGPLRWKPPQPAPSWTGVRKAAEYGPRCMQAPIFADMVFHDAGPSEDCLYLNLWMPAAPVQARLPVMVWIYGGGFAAGATSEPRQDGGNLSKKGVLVVSMNYRLGIFGFFSHPELARESGHNASGNYGLMDQLAALEWVKKNIATFGGDPDNVTIFGESAGSFSVSALMASPLAQGLFHRAIGESGAFFGSTLGLKPHAETEAANAKFTAETLGASSIAGLRAMSAADLMQAVSKDPSRRSMPPNIDGYFLPETVSAIFAAGKQAHVPLLAGWNRDEGSFRAFFGKDSPTAENFRKHAETQFGADAARFLKLYPAGSDAEARRSAQDYASDQFIAYGTWKWLEAQQETGKSVVYRYRFDQTLPFPADATTAPGTEPTAPHASEIEFVFGALSSRKLPWRPDDRKVSDLMSTYWTNFAKTGNPNGSGLPLWADYKHGGAPIMHFSGDSRTTPDNQRDRYVFLDELATRKR